jgi:hypothetical protein
MPRQGLLDCYDIDSLFSRMITTDSASSLVYGSIYQNFGIQEMSLEAVMTESESYGDGQVLDQFSRLKMVNFSCKNAWVTHAWLQAVLAGQTRTSGSSPNEKLETGFGSVNLPFFELDFQCKYTGPVGALAGDAHAIIHKGKLTKWSLGQKSESRQEVSFEGKGICLLNLESGWNFRRCFTLVENETASTLNAGAADTHGADHLQLHPHRGRHHGAGGQPAHLDLLRAAGPDHRQRGALHPGDRRRRLRHVFQRDPQRRRHHRNRCAHIQPGRLHGLQVDRDPRCA